jgi:hypothetical protein
MKGMILGLLLFSFLFTVTVAQSLGVDVSSSVSTNELSCILTSGYTNIVVRCYRSLGSPDPQAVGTISNAASAGFSSSNIDVYMFPCPLCGTSAASQVDAAVSNLVNNGANFNMFWIDVEDTNTNAYWGTDQSASQTFMIDLLIEAVNQLGRPRVGIYSSKYMWQLIFGDSNWDCCSAYQLWFADYDGNPSLSGFSSFGGWQSATRKQYSGNGNVCSVSVDLDYINNSQQDNNPQTTGAQAVQPQQKSEGAVLVALPSLFLALFFFLFLF